MKLQYTEETGKERKEEKAWRGNKSDNKEEINEIRDEETRREEERRREEKRRNKK